MGNLRFILPAILAVVAAVSCQKQEIPDSPSIETGQSAATHMSAPGVLFHDLTRVSAGQDDSGLQFRWQDSDMVGVYSLKGSMSTFRLSGGQGSSTGVFDGGGFDLRKGETYYALYPYNGLATDPAAIPVNYGSQVLSSDLSKSGLGNADYMVSSATVSEDGNASFRFAHLGAFLRLDLSPSDDATLEDITLVPHSGDILTSYTYDLARGSVSGNTYSRTLHSSLVGTQVKAGTVSSVWMAMAPQDLSSRSVSLVSASGEDLYTARFGGMKLSQSKAYRVPSQLIRYEILDEDPSYDASQKPQHPLSKMSIDPSVPAFISDGNLHQFSGIAPVSSEGGKYRFAVVSDKAKGAGVFHLDVTMSGSGDILSTSLSPLSGTVAATVSRDPEDIVCTGDAFLVSGEDQRIVEYDHDGYPTGRELAVPQDLDRDHVSFNLGFEALAYDGTGTVYTVTEGVLPEDSAIRFEGFGPLMRIQSFSLKGMKASDRYLYLMDEPYFDSPSQKAAYVHGIAAMTVLPDGRLAVLEREVYTDLSRLQASARVKVYAVSPLSDKGGVLSKSLLFECNTGIDLSTMGVNLANYEGMCSVTLPDGTPALVLISDAQGRPSFSSGPISAVLEDYLKVVCLEDR